MKLKKIVTHLLPALTVLFAGACAQAESSYGYAAAGSGPVTASARVQINVNVPLLILLRVGSASGTGDTVAFSSSLSGGVPGGPSVVADGSNTAATWNGTAPVFAASSTTATVAAYGWTNSSGGGRVSCAVTTAFPVASGLTGASVLVTSAATAGGGLAHPGTDTSCGGASTTSFSSNTLVSSTWTYSLSSALLSAATPGTSTELVTYTATTL